MAIKSFTQNATASISGSGNTQGRGTITWSEPSLPEGATNWSSITISGTWSWNGKGNISNVAINGTNTSGNVPFEVSLSTNQTSPLNITCNGNKNATGANFTWSNLVVVYTCNVLGAEVLYTKVNGIWTEVKNVYKKENGVWVLQDSLEGIFDGNVNYVKYS